MRKLSLTTLTLSALGLGILTGVFLGESASVLKPIGDGFIRLLQMAVLPYFTVALIGGFGRLTYEEAKTLGIRAAGVLLGLYALCLTLVVLIPLAFPELTSASFFSTSIVQAKKEIDFLSLYIPANPFSSLSNAVIPAVVLFGIAVGLALIGVKDKDQVLRPLATLSQALTRITGFVVRLTPIGVFALAANAAGTMSGEDLARLQVYLVSYAAGAAILTFGIVPMLVSALTPFGYRDVLRVSKDALVTGFTTGNLLIVLPLLAENCKALFRQKGLEAKHADSTVDVLVPISFTFPDIGTLLILLFVPFAAWFTGSPLDPGQYPTFIIVGFFSFFGPIEIGMPFLLDQLQIPADMFQLHVLTLVYIGRFATLVAVMHVTALAVMTASAVDGWLSLRWKAAGGFLGTSAGLMVATVAVMGLGFSAFVEPEYMGYKQFIELDPVTKPVPMQVHKTELPPPLKGELNQSRLDQIRQRGFLRVGYTQASLPYVFTNAEGRLVGLDVDMASMLARELGVSLEFVLVEFDKIPEMLRAGYCDIIMSGQPVTTEAAAQMTFTEPYLDETLAFIVRDHRRAEFSSESSVKALGSLRIGSLDLPYYVNQLRDFLPQAEIVLLASPREFFRQKGEDIDAMLLTAEGGSAWTLIYPDYSVAVPHPAVTSIPIAYAIARNEPEFRDFLTSWIALKKRDRSLEQLFDHWFRGRQAAGEEPRWSVMRNVLHWAD